jgi:hypothetical protein
MSKENRLLLPHETLLQHVEPFKGMPMVDQSTRKTQNTVAYETPQTLLSVSLKDVPTIKEVVEDLSMCLRLCHRKRIHQRIEPRASLTERTM